MGGNPERSGPFETITWSQAVRLVGGLLVAGGAVTLLYVALRRSGPGYTPLGVAIPGIIGLATGGLILLAGDRFDNRLFYPVGPVAIVLITVGQYYTGRQPIGVVLYIWIAIFSFYLHPRNHAIVNVVLIGVAQGVLLAITPGNDAPFALWFYLMSTVVVSAGAVSWLIEQLNRLAVSERQARRLTERASDKIAELNETLEARVQEQVGELERLSQLRRFLAPQVADALLTSGEAAALAPHRREIAVLFCDLRGFTAFASGAEPEEVLEVLDEYYAAVGEAVHKFEATVGSFAGDGVMAYFNDPLPCEDPPKRAVAMAVALRDRVAVLNRRWQLLGHDLGVGIGVTFGYASLGVVGFEERRDYTPLGTVVNLASRLCDEAANGQILVDRHVWIALNEHVPMAPVGELLLKGFPRLVPAYEVADTVKNYASSS